MTAAIARRHFLDLVYNFRAASYFAEYAITPTLLILSRMVQEIVIRDIDEELGGCGVWIRRARHGDCVLVVLHFIVCFVLDLSAGRFLFHTGFKAAALNHESVDHTMKDRIVELALADVI